MLNNYLNNNNSATLSLGFTRMKHQLTSVAIVSLFR